MKKNKQNRPTYDLYSKFIRQISIDIATTYHINLELLNKKDMILIVKLIKIQRK